MLNLTNQQEAQEVAKEMVLFGVTPTQARQDYNHSAKYFNDPKDYLQILQMARKVIFEGK